MNFLYYDCFSGISGDMNIGALIDIGVDQDYLLNQLSRLDVDDYDIDIRQEERKGIRGIRFEVKTTPGKTHRNLEDVTNIIKSGSFSEFVEATSMNIFHRVASAEASVHGKDINDVHFHEVGAVDSIIDIVGASLCLDYLKLDKIYSSSIELGGGFVECEHGRLPVPAPATVEILKGLPVKSGAVQYETTTPTGAAIIAESVDDFYDTFEFSIGRIGYGIGKRDTKIPNVLRVYAGETSSTAPDSAILLESNIDDMNPELYDNVMELLFDSGAVDVYFTPIVMKKSRPAVKISVLVRQSRESEVVDVILKETTTLGIRRIPIGKYMLYRDETIIKTRFGTVRIKHAYLNGKRIKSKPEYEDCKLLARANNVPIGTIYKEIDKLTGDKD